MTVGDVRSRIILKKGLEVRVEKLVSMEGRGTNPQYLSARRKGATGRIALPAMGPSIWNGQTPSGEPLLWVLHDDGTMAVYYPSELVSIE